MSKILLVGATGYVGGTVLAQLVESPEPSLKGLSFDVLVRNEQQAQKLSDVYGARVRTIIWNGLQDIPFIVETAAHYDIVINTGSGFIPEGAKAFVDGLAKRVKDGKATETPAPWFLHISGCTNLSDRPLTQTPQPLQEWDDEADSGKIFEHMRELNDREPYLQRTTEVEVLKAADASGVQAVSLNTPCIFGEGKGLFRQQAIVIPYIFLYVARHGHGFKLNETANFDTIHVQDLADFYVLLVRAILERPDRGVGYIPSGKNGIMFPTMGRVLMTEINQGALDALFDVGLLPRQGLPQDKEIRLVTLKEIADELTAGSEEVAERGWGGHKATNGTLGRKLLGWQPKFLEDAWKQDFADELAAMRDGRREITIEACIGMA